VFCSNTKLFATWEIYDLRAINKRRTFTRSSADAAVCNVFWPYTTTPVPGNVAIGFTLPVYKASRELR